MRSPNGSIHTTQTPPPLSFYSTFKFTLRYLLPDIVPIVCHRYQQLVAKFAAGVIDTDGKFAAGVVFATGVIDTSGAP
jgi:hypothetical protein